jgi:type II secretory pathway pseudopilin PulG
MKLGKFSNLKNDSGTTLVELLAAIAILSLIVTAFLAFFIQGARTNTRAGDLNEATFIAQQQMEEMVHFSQTLTIDKLSSEEGFSTHSGSLKRLFSESGYNGEISVSKIEESDVLYTVKVTITKDSRPQAILENRLSFRARDEE